MVSGTFDGMAMEPWEAELSVIDTLVNGRTATRALYLSRRVDGGWRFAYSALWTTGGAPGVVRMHLVNNGRREQSTCALEVRDGTARGTTSLVDSLTPLPVSGVAVPGYALGAFLAGTALTDGATIPLTILSCLPHRGAGAIERVRFTGTVASDTATRTGAAAAEPVWVITGDSAFAAKVSIAKSDRTILALQLPQGTVGVSTDTFVGTRR